MEEVESVPACTNILGNVGYILYFGKIDKGGKFFQNCIYKKKFKDKIRNVIVDNDVKKCIPEDCFRFFNKLKLFTVRTIDNSKVEILEIGKKIWVKKDNQEQWQVIISKKTWELFKTQIIAIFGVIRILKEENKEIYKGSIQKRFYNDYKSHPSFLLKGEERSQRNFYHMAFAILSLLSELKILTVGRKIGSKILLDVNIGNLNRFFPELEYKQDDEDNIKKEIWPYKSVVNIMIEIYNQLPESTQWDSTKGVDYSNFKKICIEKLQDQKEIDDKNRIFEKIVGVMRKSYLRTFHLRRVERTKSADIFIKNPSADNFSRIPREYKKIIS